MSNISTHQTQCCGAHASDHCCQVAKTSMTRSISADILLVFISILCPPAVAYIKTGRKDLCMSFILTLLLWAPGIFHAWYLMILHPHHHRSGSHRVVYVQGPPEVAVYEQGPYLEAVQPPQPAQQVEPQRVVGSGKPPKYGA